MCLLWLLRGGVGRGRGGSSAETCLKGITVVFLRSLSKFRVLRDLRVEILWRGVRVFTDLRVRSYQYGITTYYVDAFAATGGV